jgi:membrane AbrB-like protein
MLPDTPRLPRRPSSPALWGALIALSVLAGAGLHEIGLPAAFLLGPLMAAILVQTTVGGVKVPALLQIGAQAIIGCLIARAVTPAVVSGFLQHWVPVIATVMLSLTAGVLIGWGMSRLRIIPGTTPVWGMMPGAASTMMIMAEAYGADARLVAFMQYLRVVLVAAAGSVVAILVAHGGGSPVSPGFFPPIDLQSLIMTLALASIGAGVGLVLRIPGGVVLGSMVLCAVSSGTGWIRIELPPVLLIASYAVIGWNIGSRFTRDVLATAVRVLPQTLGAAVLLMLLCGLLSYMLMRYLHTDPLTAYLAASPGGVDAAAIIAASTKVDMPLVMMVQTVRLVVVLAIGPRLARLAAKTLAAPAPVLPERGDIGDLD